MEHQLGTDVDSDPNRPEESWTGAERLNIEADRIATLELNKAPLDRSPTRSLSTPGNPSDGRLLVHG